MYEINRNASVKYAPRARNSEFFTAIARGGTEFRSQVFLGASVHGYIYSLKLPTSESARNLYRSKKFPLNLFHRVITHQMATDNV